jgi:hypothetical protein
VVTGDMTGGVLLPLVAVGLVLLAFVLAVLMPGFREGLRTTLRCGRHGVPMCLAWSRWPSLCASSGLARWKTVSRGTGERRRSTERPVNVPGTKRWRLTPAGFGFVVKHRHGQSIDSFRAAIEALQSGLRGQVRVVRVYDRKGTLRRDRSRIVVNRRDPFAQVPPPVALSTTRFRLGVLEDGRDWVADFGALPHWLVCGSTGSGKSGWEAAFLHAVAPTDAAVVLIDLKMGVSAEPYRPRASVVAENADQAAAVLADLLAVGSARARLVKAHQVDKIDDLPVEVRPREVYVVVDEVAELGFNDGTTEGKETSTAGMRDLLRAVQLLRFAGIHVIVCGQRFGSTLGKQITNIRAQLSGRVCLRVEDAETGGMAVGDIAPEAVRAALDIPEQTKGVAVVKGGPDGWQMARVAHIPHQRLAHTAREHAGRRVPWEVVMGETTDTETTAVLPPITDELEGASS